MRPWCFIELNQKQDFTNCNVREKTEEGKFRTEGKEMEMIRNCVIFMGFYYQL